MTEQLTTNKAGKKPRQQQYEGMFEFGRGSKPSQGSVFGSDGPVAGDKNGGQEGGARPSWNKWGLEISM